jgi:hypothetical protein
MSNKLESIGTYRFEIIESGLSLSRTDKPQAVLRLKAVERYVDSPTEIAHFQQQQLLTDGKPGYLDWKAFGEETLAYLLLFNSATEFNKETVMKNYEQLQIATGWDGSSFDVLTDGSLVGKIIMGRVQEKKAYTNEQGKTIGGDGTLEVGWIDKADADPTRSLKSVDADQASKLSALLKMGMGVAKPKPAAASAPVATSSAVSAPSTASKPPKAPKKMKETPPPPLAPAVTIEETTQDAAWAYVIENKRTASDDAVTQAWIDACQAVGPEKEQTEFTGKDWLNVRTLALSKLAA